MAEIIGIGMTHYPGLHMLDEDMPVFLRRTLGFQRSLQRRGAHEESIFLILEVADFLAGSGQVLLQPAHATLRQLRTRTKSEERSYQSGQAPASD